MKAVEIFKLKRTFAPGSSEKLRKEAEDLINEKHQKGYVLFHIQFEFTDNSGYIYAFITMKTPKPQ